MRPKVVIGAGFGDEGKGKVVSTLCHDSDICPLIVRFNGGHQAGHHVVMHDNKEHVFSNFGCGSVYGCPTYWSEFCTIDPVGIIKELKVLINEGFDDTTIDLYINERCPVTTPYDKFINQKTDDLNGHGTVGVGFGATIAREEHHYSIIASDLYYPNVLEIKLALLRKHYGIPRDATTFEGEVDFLHYAKQLINSRNVNIVKTMPSSHRYIFEGSQGLLLDQNIGFFPHVTRSTTTTENINKLGFIDFDTYVVTRAYQSRHGNGPMTNEDIPHSIIKNPYEKNFEDSFQGKFRRTYLDLDLLKYALHRSNILHTGYNLVVTCLDLMENNYKCTSEGKLREFKSESELIKFIKCILSPTNLYISKSPYPEMIKYEY